MRPCQPGPLFICLMIGRPHTHFIVGLLSTCFILGPASLLVFMAHFVHINFVSMCYQSSDGPFRRWPFAHVSSRSPLHHFRFCFIFPWFMLIRFLRVPTHVPFTLCPVGVCFVPGPWCSCFVLGSLCAIFLLVPIRIHFALGSRMSVRTWSSVSLSSF